MQNFRIITSRTTDVLRLTNTSFPQLLAELIQQQKKSHIHMCSIHMYILYWIYSVNNYAVFVYFLCCVTAFVSLGAKPPEAKFAASTFSRGPICRGPICLEPFFSSDPLSVDILSFIRKVFKLIKVEAFFGILKFAIGLRILYFV